MALVRTIKAPNGATVNIYDDCMERDPEKLRSIKRQIRRTVEMITENHRDELAAKGIVKHTWAEIEELSRAVDDGRITLEEALTA